ncbi:MAG TPA: lamin tail domain-containing protein, partial [Myxococcaceae bacterium]|nr:lamin tail domain-containing protein [Myxococcaceae bacterium]
ERREWLLGQLPAVDALGDGPLVIDRVGRDASGAVWVQLYNRGGAPVSLGGLYLSGFTRWPTQWRLPALTLPPGEFLTFREGAAGTQRLGATIRPERPELSLFASNGESAVDLLWLAPLRPGEAYGRQPRGAEAFAPQPGP